MTPFFASQLELIPQEEARDPWLPLRRDIAEVAPGATYGAMINGVALFELPNGDVVVTGHCTCASRERAESVARVEGTRGAKRKVSLEEFSALLS